MIYGLAIGRKNSVGLPGKNLYPVLGRPLSLYPMLAALGSKLVDRVYLSTDDERLQELAGRNGVEVIARPPELCTNEALGEDVFVHGYREIKKKNSKKEIEFMVLLMCNAPSVTTELIEEGLAALRSNPGYDSAVSVSKYNMWSPLRARKIDKDGLLRPFIPFEAFGRNEKLSCDRDSQGDAWFADMGLSIVRPRCLEHIEEGMLPQRWMGKKIYPLKQWGGLDVDYEWQMPQVEYWLKKHGFSKGPEET